MMKNDNNYQTTFNNQLIENLPLRKFEGQIHLIENVQQFHSIKSLLKSCSEFGFDTETRPSFRKGTINKVALLQMATHEHAFIFRLNKIGLPGFLRFILEDSKITKIGVAIRDDLKAINRISPLQPDGFIDLQQYVTNFNIGDKSLKKITAQVLGFRISKRFQTSNWEEETLSLQQLEYAATDAWVCLEIYKKLNHIKHTRI
jgi:ribonuclease D